MHIACSTLCFASRPLEEALKQISALEFTQVEIALVEGWAHLNPSEVARDLGGVVRRIRLGPGLSPAALYVRIAAQDPEEYLRQLQAICRMAKMLTASCITIPPALAGSDLDAEVRRLFRLCSAADQEGITLNIENEVGRLAQEPATAVELCKAVPGLGLTLDPSHYINGPHQNKDFSQVFPYVQHVHLRDTATGANQKQVPVGQGLVEYSRIMTQLLRNGYRRTLSIEIIDQAGSTIDVESEVRKLKLLLESLL